MRQSLKFQRIAGLVVAQILLLVGAVVVLMPLVWMLSTSLKTAEATATIPPQWIPMEAVTVVIEGRECYVYVIPVDGIERRLALLDKQGAVGTFVNPDNLEERYELPVQDGRRVYAVRLHWENYVEAMTAVPFGRYLVNSLRIAVIGTIGTILSCTLVAYGFARFRAKGLGILFLLLLSTTMLPPQVTLIPTFILFKKIGWYDTFWPLIVPAFFANAYDVFLLRQFMMTLPLELDDAARIDGCGPLGILWHIILPQAKPVIATIIIFSILYYWNDFFTPLIYLQTPSKMTVALGLQSFNALYTRKTHLLMAASTVTLLPSILIFFFAQKLFIQGVVISGIKG